MAFPYRLATGSSVSALKRSHRSGFGDPWSLLGFDSFHRPDRLYAERKCQQNPPRLSTMRTTAGHFVTEPATLSRFGERATRLDFRDHTPLSYGVGVMQGSECLRGAGSRRPARGSLHNCLGTFSSRGWTLRS
nr:MAG TPA: hypothetical protein [Caudoviricetes sp.]